MYVGRWETTAK